MQTLLLRILLATSVSCAAVWLIYEQLWISYQYDQETAKLETELQYQGLALITQFDDLQADSWPRTVARYNRRNDSLLVLLTPSDPDWSIFKAEIHGSDTERLYVDAYDATASILLHDERTILQLESFFLEIEDEFDIAFLLFILLGIAVGVPPLYLILAAYEDRLTAIDQAAGDFISSGKRRLIPIRGSGTLARLEQRINDLTAHLDTAVGDLQQSISNQRDLLHAVAHEFRSPIARLRFAQDMLDDSGNEDERKELLGQMDQAIDELDDLVSEVLGYSRIRHGGYRLNYVNVNLSTMANGVISKLRALYPAIQFEYLGEPDSESVQVDQRMLERALINLVRNAARFATSRVELSSRFDHQFFILRVADDGPGIPPGRRERVFEPFTRLDDSRSRDSGGIGLGLAIVHAISVQHQGQVSVHDSELGGAEFELRWPRQSAPD